MVKILLTVVLNLAFAGLVAGVKSPEKNFGAQRSVLTVSRGGAGPLDPAVVAKTSTALALTNSVFGWLGPEETAESYGIKDPSKEALVLLQRSHAVYFACTLATYLLICSDQDVYKSIGYGTFPILADILRSVLNDDQSKVGLSNLGQVLLVATPFLLTSYACLQKLDNVDTIVQLCSAYHGVRGLYYLLNPKGASKAWGITGGGDETHVAMVRIVGVSLISFAFGCFLLVRGVDNFKFVGYSYIPFALYTIWMQFNEEMEYDKALYNAWLAVALVVIGTLAI